MLTPISIKITTFLGPQLSPDVTSVSRDGGYSTLINGKIIWIYDDTECLGHNGTQLSFMSNTASSTDPNQNASVVHDYGVVMVGKDSNGREQNAILAGTAVGTGGWIPFEADEIEFNRKMQGKRRIAIWPGVSPTSTSTQEAFFYAPLVHVDFDPEDPSKKFQCCGTTLVTMTAPDSGPVAIRKSTLVIAESEVPFGGFASLLGVASTESDDQNVRDVYLIGVADNGLQVARVGLDNHANWEEFLFFDPQNLSWSTTAPSRNLSDHAQLYLPGSFTSGNAFYSPYFSTFILIYFNGWADSTFYIRYLDLSQPKKADNGIWRTGGKSGRGIQADDAEALVMYGWSPEQKLYESPQACGGFNYAGNAHPEYFNRKFFAPSLYPSYIPWVRPQNDWYGSSIISEADASEDGRHLLLSWVCQKQKVGTKAFYEVQIAKVEFDDIVGKSGDGSEGSVSGSSTVTSFTQPEGGGHHGFMAMLKRLGLLGVILFISALLV